MVSICGLHLGAALEFGLFGFVRWAMPGGQKIIAISRVNLVAINMVLVYFCSLK